MSDQLLCWKCGTKLQNIILPFSRREECAQCGMDQHVCKLCIHYAPNTADACAEERAEQVNDKESANFCDYFEPANDAYGGKSNPEQSNAATELADLFGDETPASQSESTMPTEADAALNELKNLFGDDED